MKIVDVRRLCKYLYNTDEEQFSQDIYHKKPDSYTKEKFQKMQGNAIAWMGTLDDNHMQRLVDKINEYEG